MSRTGFSLAKSSLAVTFTLIIATIFIMGQGPLWIWFLFTQKDRYSQMLKERAEMASRFLANSAAVYLAIDDNSALMEAVDLVAQDDEIITVRVLNKDGLAIASATNEVEERERSGNPLFIPWRNNVHEEIELFGEPLGKVEIIYSGKRANEAMKWMLLIPSIAQGLVFVAIVCFIFGFTYFKLGKPIGILSERMGRITSGDLTVEIPEMKEREIGVIADGLRFLVQRLSATVRRINSVSSNVMETIGGLSSSFENSMGMVKKQSTSTDEIALTLKTSLESQKRIAENTDQLSGISNENVSSLMEVKASQDEMVQSMGNLHGATEKSYAIVSEMIQISKNVNLNLHQVLSSVENTSASVEEIIASVREVENSARESSRIAESVREKAAQEGVVTVDKAIRGMEKITEKVTYSVDIVNRLGQRSDDVQSILSVMKEVTDQTNLLSINASILAEQAGEYGKGFSVVAQEMRELSERAEGYTKDIAGIVSTIQNEIGEAVKSIDEGMVLVRGGSQFVLDVGETMSTILDAALESANMTKMIERSTEAQVTALKHVEASVVEVNTVSSGMNEVMQKLNRSTRFIMDHLGDVKDVAETTKKGMSEQSDGVNSITRNMETTNERVADINEATTRQRMLEEGLFTEVEEIRNAGVWIVSDMERVSNTLSRLKEDVEVLKREMETFRIS